MRNHLFHLFVWKHIAFHAAHTGFFNHSLRCFFVCYFALVCLEFELFKCNSLLPFRYCTAFLSFTKSNNFRLHLHFPSLGYVISFQTSYSVQFSWLTFTSSYKQAWQFISRCCFDWLIQADNTFTKFVESFFLYYVFSVELYHLCWNIYGNSQLTNYLLFSSFHLAFVSNARRFKYRMYFALDLLAIKLLSPCFRCWNSIFPFIWFFLYSGTNQYLIT